MQTLYDENEEVEVGVPDLDNNQEVEDMDVDDTAHMNTS